MGKLSQVYGNSVTFAIFSVNLKLSKNKSLFETTQKSQAYNKVENNPEFVVLYVGSKVKSFPEELNPKQSFKNATEKVQREIRSLKKVPNTAKSKKVHSFKSESSKIKGS